MKNKKNLASILIINYNNWQYIDRAIKSCLRQSYKNIEILFFDDKSTDTSINVIKKYRKNSKFRSFRNLNKKKNIPALDAANAYFFLFKKSKGKIIFLLDSDDYFKPEKVQNIVTLFNNHKDVRFIQNLPLEVINKKKIKKNNLNSKLSFWPYLAPESCISFRKEFMVDYLKFNKKYKYNFKKVWLGFRMGVYSYFVKKNFNTINKHLTYYESLGESWNYSKLNYNWISRRKQSFDYLYQISNKNIKYKLNLDYMITYILYHIVKMFH